ncbi:hypothetical protein [Rhizobium sp. PL01]|uniref:hypothetical protein n=1 Tax=Rhizobium sp. PL01 TaxID=3085631 RepID=UPI00298159B9|nr:hypothetical protein [Rhizobium sp. PL01]MDW5313757.1 hypothetical protein [Rhizobium sp. PL01]
MIQADEIADLLGWKTRWFRRQVKKLISIDGMPSPLPSGRWHRAKFMAWLESYGDLKTKANGKGLLQIRIDWDREELTRKYAPHNQTGRAA